METTYRKPIRHNLGVADMLLSNVGSAVKGVAEWAPFAATLAGRLAHLLARGQLTVGGPLWQLALEQLLLRCVDTETQVRVGPDKQDTSSNAASCNGGIGTISWFTSP